METEYAQFFSRSEFHDSRSKFKGLVRPLGGGKTMAAAFEALQCALQNPGTIGLMCAPTYPILRDSMVPALLDALNHHGIPYQYNIAENVVTLQDSKSQIVCRSADELWRSSGTELSWFGVDELASIPESAWIILETRLREKKAEKPCGFATWTPKDRDWIYRRFTGHPDQFGE